MRCTEVMELMQRNLDGDLSPEEYSEMELHIQACIECQELNEKFKQLSFELESLPDIDPPFSLVDSILPQISPSFDALVLPGVSTRKRTNKRNWVLGGSAAAILVAAGLLSLNKTDHFFEELSKGKNQIAAKDQSQITVMSGKQEESQKSIAGKIASPTVIEKDKTVEAPAFKPKPNGSEAAETENKSAPKPITKQEPVNGPSKQPLESDKTQNDTQKSMEAPTNTPSGGSQSDHEPVNKPLDSQSEVALASQPTTESGPMAMAPSIASSSVQSSSAQPSLAASGSSVPAVHSMNKMQAPDKGIYPSPDGKWTAVVLTQSIAIRNSDGAEVFHSHQWDQLAQVAVRWLDSQQVAYDLTLPKGVEHWVINVALTQEQKINK